MGLEEMNLPRLVASSLIFFILIMPIISAPVLADGVWIRPESDYTAWATVKEESQFGIINYFNGTEKLVISVGLGADDVETSEKIAWVFPVPSEPEDIKLRIMSVVPRISGDSIGTLFMQKLRDNQAWLYCVYASQLYTLPYLLYNMPFYGSGGIDEGTTKIFDEIQMYGMSAVVIQPESTNALNQYVNEMGIKLPSYINETLEYYIQEDYSLVLAHIFNVSGFVENAMKVNIGGEMQYLLGLCAEFPTEKIFFPLRVTSAYGNEQIPITIQIVDYVTPPSNPGLAAGMSLNANFLKEFNYGPHNPISGMIQYSNESLLDLYYFFDDRLSPYDQEDVRYGFLIPVEYTQIEIRGPANGLTQDLWFDDQPHSTVGIYQAMTENAFAFVLILFAFISAIAGLIAGLILFRGRNFATPKYRFGILGLFNILTIFGVFFGIYLFTERKFIAVKEGDPGPSLKDRKWSYTALFSAIFLGLAIISNVIVILLAA